jgi:tetratricopeptide (TPR) repeat protein
VVNQAQGNHDQAIALLQRALESSRTQGPISTANAMTCLGAALVSTGDLDEAERLQQEALRLFRDAGASASEAVALSHLGAVYLERNDVSAAYEAYDRSWRIARELQARDCEAHALEGRAHCSYRQGLPGEGLDRFNQASEIYRKLGMWTRVERIKALLERLERLERREQPE